MSKRSKKRGRRDAQQFGSYWWTNNKLYTPIPGGPNGDGRDNHDGDDHSGGGAGSDKGGLPFPGAGGEPGGGADPFGGEPLTTPLVGWKGLTLNQAGLLLSAHGAQLWPERERHEARCTGGGLYNFVYSSYPSLGSPPPRGGHSVPDPGCNCGFHSAINLDMAMAYVPEVEFSALAHVYLWGRCVINDTGYRAQYAYPKRVYVVTENEKRGARLAQRVRHRYGVPAEVLSRDDMLDWSAGLAPAPELS